MASYKLDKGFLVSRSWAASLRMLSPENFHRVFWELYDYQDNEGAEGAPGLHGDPAVDILVSLILPQIDNRLQGSRGGRTQRCRTKTPDLPPDTPPVSPPVSPKLSQDKSSQDKVREAEISEEIPPKAAHTRTAFTPPSVEEVEEYCRTRSCSVDAQRFVDYYASKGWTVGKSPMKDWKAAVRNWERSTSSFPAASKDTSGWDYIEAVAKGEAI